MEKNEILEGNKLIAEFMGLRQSKSEDLGGQSKEVWYDSKGYRVIDGNAIYHKSWDWLMPVVGRISEISHKKHEYPLDDCEGYNKFIYESFRVGAEYNDINTVYLGAIEFIQWHSQNKSKP